VPVAGFALPEAATGGGALCQTVHVDAVDREVVHPLDDLHVVTLRQNYSIEHCFGHVVGNPTRPVLIPEQSGICRLRALNRSGVNISCT